MAAEYIPTGVQTDSASAFEELVKENVKVKKKC